MKKLLSRNYGWLKITLILVLALSITACSATKNNTTATSNPTKTNQGTTGDRGESSESKEAASGGELSYALATSPDSLDPHRSGMAVAVRVYRTIHDSLVVQLPDNSIKPWLATEWTVSPDNLSYTFKLREDVKFHDGTLFNAEAVKFNFDRILDPNIPATSAMALLTSYKSAEVIDEYIIKLNLSTPSRAFLSNLGQAALGIISPTAAKEYGDKLGHHPVGTGPFKFVKWEENAEIKVERNPDYNWAPELVSNKGAAYLDSIVFKIVPEEATRIGSVQSKQVLAAETVPPQNILSLKNDPNFQLYQKNTGGLPFTLFFNQDVAPWNEEKARVAVKLAVDVDTIVKTLYLGTYDRAWGPLSPGMFGYEPALENSWVPDVEKSKQLLDELGWKVGADGIREKDGKKLTLHYVDRIPNREKRNDIALIIQQQLKQIGISVDIELTKDVTGVIYSESGYDLFGNSMVSSDSSAISALYHSTAPDARPSLSRLKSPEIDKLLEQGEIESDDAKRAEIYKEIQRYIVEKAVILPIYVFPYTVAASKSVQGLVFDALGYPLFNDVSLQK